LPRPENERFCCAVPTSQDCPSCAPAALRYGAGGWGYGCYGAVSLAPVAVVAIVLLVILLTG
jgi:hypothetical protein